MGQISTDNHKYLVDGQFTCNYLFDFHFELTYLSKRKNKVILLDDTEIEPKIWLVTAWMEAQACRKKEKLKKKHIPKEDNSKGLPQQIKNFLDPF